MQKRLNSEQRLMQSTSYKKSEKTTSDNFDYNYDDEEEIFVESDPLIEQVMELYGKEYDYSNLTEDELKIFLEYALDAYKNQNFSALQPENLPIDLKIKLNSLPIIEIEKDTSEKQEKQKTEKKEMKYSWNKKFSSLSNKHDKENVIIEAYINGCSEDATKFIDGLMGAYVLFAENSKFKVDVLEISDKKISLLINGEDAYKNFKFEKGMHYIKGKEFNSNIFISVLPQIDEQQTEIKINPNDLKIDTYRSSGAGGQHINKTSSAVRITHLPTGIVVTCQEERSQIQNKRQAMKLLYAKLTELEEEKKIDGKINQRLEAQETTKIRTYDLNNNILIDHRIGLKIGIEQGIEKFNLEKVVRKLQDIHDKMFENIAKDAVR